MIFEEMESGFYDKAERKARMAFELYEDGNSPKALAAMEDALEINPSNSSWHFNKALILDSINRFEDAIIEYEHAIELSGSDLETLNSLAVDYTRMGQYDLAIETFERIEGLDSGFEPCYCNRIITYTEMGQHDLAEQMFYLAQQIEPDCPLCFYNIGNSLFVRGEYKKAIHCWLKTAELEPTHPQINFRIAQACWSVGENEQAREYFLAELRNNPGDIDTIVDFGLFLLEAGDLESAKEKFNRILELCPDCGAALFYLGEVEHHNGNFEQAAELYTQAMEKNGILAGPRYRLAEYSLLLGDKERARAYLVCEMELAEEDVETLVSMGSMFLATGDFDLSSHCLLKAVDINCACAEAYYYLGLVSTMQGLFEESAEFFCHALDIRGDYACALRDLSVAYLAMGRLKDAGGMIKKALSVDGTDALSRAVSRRIRSAYLRKTINDFLRSLRFRAF